MNYKQKLRYKLLGAVIILVGIGTGSIISPPLIAQHNGTNELLDSFFSDEKLRAKVIEDAKKIQVGVIAGDNDLDSQVVSYIKRELRSLGDVLPSDKHTHGGYVQFAPWQLHLNVLENKLVDGRKTGYTVSAIVVSNVYQNNREVADQLLKECADNSTSLWSILIDPMYQNNYLVAGGTHELDRICKKIITRFDIDYLEPERKRRSNK